MGVAVLPGLALQAHRAPGIHATEIPGNARQIFAVTYGEPPDPPPCHVTDITLDQIEYVGYIPPATSC
jgi:hypothetical protein